MANGTTTDPTRDRILDVATGLMAERGYAATSIGAICRDVDLAPTAIYWHFGNKEGLLAAVIERSVGQWYDELQRGLTDVEPSFDRFAGVMAESYRRHPEPLRLLLFMGLDRSHPDPDVRATVQRMRRRALDRIAEAIADALPLGSTGGPGHIHQALARHMLVLLDGTFLVSEIDDRADLLDELFSTMGTSLAAVGLALLEATPTPGETERSTR